MKQVVCQASELGPGQMVSAQLGPMPVAVIRAHDGELYGLLDKCLHQGGRLSRGKLERAYRADQPAVYDIDPNSTIVKCPWHGYEYNVRTGCTLFDPDRKLRTFKVREEDGQIVVEA